VYLYLKIRTLPPSSARRGSEKGQHGKEKNCVEKEKRKKRKIYRFITNGKSKGKIVHEQ
jgi:hypothetical protein